MVLSLIFFVQEVGGEETTAANKFSSMAAAVSFIGVSLILYFP
jgi:hypothetical protein